MIALTLFLVALAPVGGVSTASPPGTVILARQQWTAIARPAVCEALSRPAGRADGQAGFAFARDRSNWGRFAARLSRPPRAGTTVMLRMDGRDYLLAARGQYAWARDAAQDRALIDGARAARGMAITYRDQGGRRVSDRYDLGGAPSAIDAAAAACSGAGQLR